MVTKDQLLILLLPIIPACHLFKKIRKILKSVHYIYHCHCNIIIMRVYNNPYNIIVSDYWVSVIVYVCYYLCGSLCMRVIVYLCLCVFDCMCYCVCVYVCMCVIVCMCMYVFMYVCVTVCYYESVVACVFVWPWRHVFDVIIELKTKENTFTLFTTLKRM